LNFALQKTQGDPPQIACDPFSLCKSKWALPSKSHNSNQRQKRERAKIMDADGVYIDRRGRGWVGVHADARAHLAGPRRPAGEGEGVRA
jgi:hypothetical protein